MPHQEVLFIFPVFSTPEVREVEGEALAVGQLVPDLPRKVDHERLDQEEERHPLVVRDLPPRALTLHELAQVWVDNIFTDLEESDIANLRRPSTFFIINRGGGRRRKEGKWRSAKERESI